MTRHSICYNFHKISLLSNIEVMWYFNAFHTIAKIPLFSIVPTIFPNKWVIYKALMLFVLGSKVCPLLCFHHKDYMYCFWYNRTNSNFLQITAEFLMRTCPWLLHLRAWDLGLLFSSWLDILQRKSRNRWLLWNVHIKVRAS